MTATPSLYHPDPLLFDAERLRELASDPIVRRGIAYFNEHRVTDLQWEGSRLWASVDGSKPYDVDIAVDEDGEPGITCSCPFDWEPACKHAVAALLAYAARLADSDDAQVRNAAEEAIADRQKRARTQVLVEHVAGDPTFGTWEARSITSAGARLRSYRVEVRSVAERLNHCTCPDFATNRLGTCKHIEAVLHHLRKRQPSETRKEAQRGPRVSVVYLTWDAPAAPRIRLYRKADPIAAEARLLDAHFDDAGFLRGSLPDAFFRFEAATRNADSIHLGADAHAHAVRLAARASHRAKAERLARDIRRSGGQLPGVDARLYPYQVDGVAFLASNGRAVLADDMGLGKTLQAIAASRVLMDADGVRRTLVVCPASLKHQWAREITRFTGLPAQIVQGPPPARLAQYRAGAAFTIVNYELVLRDVEVLQREVAPDLLILDEAQRIKNWRTKTATAIKTLETRYAFVLSGTPLENRLEDLYSVMQVVDQRLLGPLWRFMIDFHVLDERGKVLGYRNLSELRGRLQPALLRRDRALVRDQLPDRVEQRLDVPLSPRQQELHDEAIFAAAKIARIQKRRPLTPTEERRLLAALQTARMACNAAGLVDKATEGSPKLDELARLLEELCIDGGRKVVVFSQWERMTAMAEAVATRLQLGTVRLHGGVPTSRRGALLDRFRDDPATQVFLSTDAGGVGLNLQAATALINLDLPWNPAVLDQRIARIHRLGQHEPVNVILLVGAGSYEERILGLLSAKRELFTNVLAEGDADVVGMSKRAVEAVLTTLEKDGGEELPRPEEAVDSGPAEEAPPQPPRGPVASGAAEVDPATDAALNALVERIQAALGPHIERILVSTGGLLVVTDGDVPPLEEDLNAPAALAVTIVDRATYASLQRFAQGALLAHGSEVYSRADQDAPRPDPLATLARRKLEAGEVLLERGCVSEGLALLATAMRAAIASRCGRDEPPKPQSLAVWLYADALPAGDVTAEQADVLIRAHALAGAPEVPELLARQVRRDARALVLGSIDVEGGALTETYQPTATASAAGGID